MDAVLRKWMTRRARIATKQNLSRSLDWYMLREYANAQMIEDMDYSDLPDGTLLCIQRNMRFYKVSNDEIAAVGQWNNKMEVAKISELAKKQGLSKECLSKDYLYVYVESQIRGVRYAGKVPKRVPVWEAEGKQFEQ